MEETFSSLVHRLPPPFFLPLASLQPLAPSLPPTDRRPPAPPASVLGAQALSPEVCLTAQAEQILVLGT